MKPRLIYTVGMCGRYALYGPVSRLREQFEVDFDEIDFRPHYNLAPMQHAPVIREVDRGERHVALLRWGLLPSWAKGPTIAARLFNARAETAATKPSFRAAFKARRCLIPADGFYEWAPAATGGKQPHFIRLASGAPMALAGLWEHWTAPAGEEVSTFTILTIDANERLAPIHDRMPVILPPETWSLWLNPARTPAQVAPLLRPYPSDSMQLWPVSKRVGNVRADDPSLIELVPPAAGS
jgi:putative SOS response-associated peptidase YedK